MLIKFLFRSCDRSTESFIYLKKKKVREMSKKYRVIFILEPVPSFEAAE